VLMPALVNYSGRFFLFDFICVTISVFELFDCPFGVHVLIEFMYRF